MEAMAATVTEVVAMVTEVVVIKVTVGPVMADRTTMEKLRIRLNNSTNINLVKI